MVEIAKNSNEMTYTLIDGWLQEYYSTNNKYRKAKTKTLIVTRMLPIIKKIARTIARRSYDPIDDLVQAGSIGLLKAIDSFSFDKNNNFKIYAGYLIIGEMKHYLRDKLNTIRVPRHIQELSIRINNFTQTLTMEELNNITNDDVAEALNISSKVVDSVIIADRRKSVISLDDMYMNSNSESLGYEELISENNYEEIRDLEDMKIILRDVIEKLPEESKKLVKMYYYEDMSQKEIAEKLDISQMQISRKMKKAFSQLYHMMADANFDIRK